MAGGIQRVKKHQPTPTHLCVFPVGNTWLANAWQRDVMRRSHAPLTVLFA